MISSANSNFVLNALFLLGIPASLQRSGSLHQSSVKNSLASTIEAKSPLLRQANTATCELDILPTLPQYCHPTPTLLSPFLAQPLSSMISPVSFLFGRIELTSLET